MKRLLLLAVLTLLVSAASVPAQRTDSAKKYVKHGLERFAKNDIAGAIADYDRAISVDPKLADAYLNRGKAKRAAGDLDGAIADYEVMADLDLSMAMNNRDITQAYLNRGYIRSNHMDLDGALADFDIALQLDPNDADAFLNRRRAFLIVGKANFAIADLDKSISSDDRRPSVEAERGFAGRRQGESGAAQTDSDRGLEGNED